MTNLWDLLVAWWYVFLIGEEDAAGKTPERSPVRPQVLSLDDRVLPAAVGAFPLLPDGLYAQHYAIRPKTVDAKQHAQLVVGQGTLVGASAAPGYQLGQVTVKGGVRTDFEKMVHSAFFRIDSNGDNRFDTEIKGTVSRNESRTLWFSTQAVNVQTPFAQFQVVVELKKGAYGELKVQNTDLFIGGTHVPEAGPERVRHWVRPKNDLVVTVSGPQSVEVGSVARFRVTVKNRGSQPAHDVHFRITGLSSDSGVLNASRRSDGSFTFKGTGSKRELGRQETWVKDVFVLLGRGEGDRGAFRVTVGQNTKLSLDAKGANNTAYANVRWREPAHVTHDATMTPVATVVQQPSSTHVEAPAIPAVAGLPHRYALSRGATSHSPFTVSPADAVVTVETTDLWVLSVHVQGAGENRLLTLIAGTSGGTATVIVRVNGAAVMQIAVSVEA